MPLARTIRDEGHCAWNAPGLLPEDYELWLRGLEAGACFEEVPRELIVWNDPPDRMSRTDTQCSMENLYQMKSAHHTAHGWLEGRDFLLAG